MIDSMRWYQQNRRAEYRAEAKHGMALSLVGPKAEDGDVWLVVICMSGEPQKITPPDGWTDAGPAHGGEGAFGHAFFLVPLDKIQPLVCTFHWPEERDAVGSLQVFNNPISNNPPHPLPLRYGSVKRYDDALLVYIR